MAKHSKVEKVMHEWGEGKLHSGSKHGPEVTSHKQAVAIALSEARKKGEDYPAKAKEKVHHSPEMLQVDHNKQHKVVNIDVFGGKSDFGPMATDVGDKGKP